MRHAGTDPINDFDSQPQSGQLNVGIHDCNPLGAYHPSDPQQHPPTGRLETIRPRHLQQYKDPSEEAFTIIAASWSPSPGGRNDCDCVQRSPTRLDKKELLVYSNRGKDPLCPSLVEKTMSLWQADSHHLLISWRKSHKAVSSATVARWIRSILEESGIDVKMFKAHSTRAAATSAARSKSASVSDIMKMAGWTRASTFETYYHKHILSAGINLADTWNSG